MSRPTAFIRLRAAWLCVVCLSFTAPAFADVTKGPDKGGYSGTDIAVFSFIDVAASGGAGILSGIDDGTAALTLPFAFKLYGQSYTTVCVSSNGALYFIPSVAACNGINDFANTDLTNAAPPPGQDYASVFPFWSDLNFEGAGAGVYYQALGNAGSRQFVLQWNNAVPIGSANAVTFEVVLYEGSNKILFQYQTVGLGAGNPASNGGLATVGIRNVGAPANEQLIAWSHLAPVLSDSLALLYTGALLTPSVNATGGTFTYNGSPHAGSGSALGSGGEVLTPPVVLSYVGTGATTYGPTTAAPTNVGAYELTATFNGNDSYASGSDTDALIIAAATPTITFGTAPAATYPGGDFTVSASTSNTDSSALVYSVVSGPCTLASGATFTPTGIGSCTVKASGAASANFNTAEAQQIVNIAPAGNKYSVTGFFAPVDMSSGNIVVWNVARAGATVPLKWHLTLNGAPVSDPGSFTGLVTAPVSCSDGAGTVNLAIEQYAAGNSTLQYLGDGNWQFNWRTPESAARTCVAVYVKFSDGTTSPGANFRFR